MKLIYISVLYIVMVSCNSVVKDGSLTLHNPYDEISQNIENKEAIMFFEMGHLFQEQGKLDSAVQSLKQSLKIEKSSITLNSLGIISLQKKDFQEAKEYFFQARSFDGSYWPAYINEARSYTKLDDSYQARNLLLLLKNKTKSDYWISYADYKLAVIYFNEDGNCDSVYKLLQSAKRITTDSEFNRQYSDFKEHVDRNCG